MLSFEFFRTMYALLESTKKKDEIKFQTLLKFAQILPTVSTFVYFTEKFLDFLVIDLIGI